jgi:hypothetical protein
VPKPFPYPPSGPDHATQAILGALQSFAATTPETTPEQHEAIVNGLQWLMLDAELLFNRSLSAAQRGGVSYLRLGGVVGVQKSTIQTRVTAYRKRAA